MEKSFSESYKAAGVDVTAEKTYIRELHQLEEKIKSNEYKRLPEASKLKLIINDKINIKNCVR